MKTLLIVLVTIIVIALALTVMSLSSHTTSVMINGHLIQGVPALFVELGAMLCGVIVAFAVFVFLGFLFTGISLLVLGILAFCAVIMVGVLFPLLLPLLLPLFLIWAVWVILFKNGDASRSES